MYYWLAFKQVARNLRIKWGQNGLPKTLLGHSEPRAAVYGPETLACHAHRLPFEPDGPKQTGWQGWSHEGFHTTSPSDDQPKTLGSSL